MTADARLYLEQVERVVGGVSAERAVAMFRLLATEGARLIDDGHIAKIDMVDALAGIAARTGIGDDQAVSLIAAALEHPNVRPRSVVPDGLIAVRASDIIPEAIVWLWPGRFPLGKLAIIAGEPGLGKSQLTLWMAATVTRDGEWPNGEGRAEKGSIVVLSAEDDPTDTVRPRLDAAGADPVRVHLILAAKRDAGRRTAFDLQQDLHLLEMLIENVGDVRLVVIDPITAYLGKVDSHRNAELRAVLTPIAEMAARRRVVVAAVTHLNKAGAGGGSANARFMGSVAFVAGPRAAFIVAADAEDDERKLFLQSKNNLGPRAPGLAFRTVDRVTPTGLTASAVEWEPGTVAMSANDALAASVSVTRSAPELESAANFLRELLRDGPRAVKEIELEARTAGYAWRTIRKAKESLGVDSSKMGMAGEWFWSLPPPKS